jgi:hypothetical protein
MNIQPTGIENLSGCHMFEGPLRRGPTILRRGPLVINITFFLVFYGR